jgi:hypothetical protein
VLGRAQEIEPTPLRRSAQRRVECGLKSEGARGWRAFLTDDEPAAVYCPECPWERFDDTWPLAELERSRGAVGKTAKRKEKTMPPILPAVAEQQRDTSIGTLHERQRVLETAYAATPERFVRRPPTPPALPTAARINKPTTQEAAH